MPNLKKLTLLHSNDMHGDFMAEQLDNQLMGGISLLSGYIEQVRREEENVLYTISGDMFQGSLIDQEYRGLSTIELMNMLTPNVATLGNHEVDYGLTHLLFLEKCARFPIINANLYIKSNHVRLFKSHVILEVDGMKILFIGIITEEVLSKAKQEKLVGALVDVRDAAQEVGKICDSYRTEDIDFTVLLTHIGFQADQELAALLNPEWGVDLIIGGHTHTVLEEPCVVAGIPIVQAGTGTDQIGRFDLTIDTDTNSIHSMKWQLIPIDDSHCPRDGELEAVLHQYKTATDEKYGRYLTRFAGKYTHPRRDRETELGKIFADLYRDSLGLDVMMFGSGTLRKTELGPIVTYKDLVEIIPYDEAIYRVTMTGAQFKQALCYIHRPEAFADGAHGEMYQFSQGLHFVCDTKEGIVGDISFDGKTIDDTDLLHVGMHKFHFVNLEKFMSLPEEDVKANKPPRVAATSSLAVADEWFSQQELVKLPADARWEMK